MSPKVSESLSTEMERSCRIRDMKDPEQQGKEIMKWFFEECGKASPRNWPAKPEALEQFLKQPQKVQEQYSDRIYSREDVKEYQSVKWENQLHNRDWFLYLQKFYEMADEKQKPLVDAKMAEFYEVISEQSDIYPPLRLDFNKYHVPQTGEQLVMDELNTAQGENDDRNNSH